jgi:hypothetical protein
MTPIGFETLWGIGERPTRNSGRRRFLADGSRRFALGPSPRKQRGTRTCAAVGSVPADQVEAGEPNQSQDVSHPQPGHVFPEMAEYVEGRAVIETILKARRERQAAKRAHDPKRKRHGGDPVNPANSRRRELSTA